MSTHLQKLVKYLSEGDYQPVKGYNIINPPTHCTHEITDCDCPCKHETDECICQAAICDCQDIEKQKGEHVTSSGAKDWMTPDEGHAGKFGMKKPGLQPYTSLVRRVGKVPYFATRWRKTEVKGLPAEVKIIPVDNYTGDLEQVYDSWELYVKEKDGQEDTKDLLLPLLGLQEFIEEDRKGILAQLGNRIIGLVSIMVDELGEARISILTASPREIEDGKEEYVEDALREGLETYASSREWNLLHSHKEDMENLARQSSLKKAYRLMKDMPYVPSVEAQESIAADKADRANKAAEARKKKWVPKSGDWEYPDSWIKSEDTWMKTWAKENNVDLSTEEGKEKAQTALEAHKNKGGKRKAGTREGRRRNPYSMNKYPEENRIKVEWSEDITTADGQPASGWLRDAEPGSITKNTDPNAEHQFWYRNKKGDQRIVWRQGFQQDNADYKWHRGREFAEHVPAIMDKLREGIAAGYPKSEIPFMMAITSMRLGGKEPGQRAGTPTRGVSTLLGENIRLDGDKIEIRVVTKATSKKKDTKQVVTKLGPFENKELADILRSKNVPEVGQSAEGKNRGHLWPDVSTEAVRNHWDEFIVGKNGLQLPTAQDPETDQQSGFQLKDLRTFGGRTAFLEAVEKRGTPRTKEEYNEIKAEAVAAVAKRLGNDSKTALKSYIDPVLVKAALGDPKDLPDAQVDNLWDD